MKTNKNTILFRAALLWMGTLASAMAQTPATVVPDQQEVVEWGSGNVSFSAEGGSTVSPDESCYTKTGNKRYTWTYETFTGNPASGATSSSSTLQIPRGIAGETTVKVKLEEEYKHNDTGIKVWVSAGRSTNDVKHANVVVSPTAQNLRDICYFGDVEDMEAGPNWKTKKQLEVFNGGSRAFSFNATVGDDKVLVIPDTGNKKCTYKSLAASTAPNDVTISVYFGEDVVANVNLTVQTCVEMQHLSYEDKDIYFIDDTFPGTGLAVGFSYETWCYTRAKDLNGDGLIGVRTNETFGDSLPDYVQGTNWGLLRMIRGPGFADDTGKLDDKYSVGYYYALVLLPSTALPKPISKDDPDASVKVWHIEQNYFVGSADSGRGLKRKTHKLQYNLGNARQDPIL